MFPFDFRPFESHNTEMCLDLFLRLANIDEYLEPKHIIMLRIEVAEPCGRTRKRPHAHGR